MKNNKGIIPKVKLVPEAKPRDTNDRVVLFPLSILGRKHILKARSMAEYIYFLSTKSASIWIIIPEVKLVPEVKLRDTNSRVVLFPLSILGCKHIVMAQSMTEGPDI